MKRILLLSGILCSSAALWAQESTRSTTTVRIEEQRGDTVEKTTIVVADGDTLAKKTRRSLSIGTDGIVIKRQSSASGTRDSVRAKPNPRFATQWGMVDLGFNRLHDNTDLSTVPDNHESIFRLRESKSINVNVWVFNGRLRLNETRRQKWYMTTGLGLQMYNFRFEAPYQYTSASPEYPTLIDSSRQGFQKNKLGFTYASIPLGLLGKTRIGDKWLVYGGGVMGGMRIASWTKLKTEGYGKEKNHDAFNFQPFNACVYGELGVDDIIRLYGTYQLTALNKTGVDQHPFAIGIRFIGL